MVVMKELFRVEFQTFFAQLQNFNHIALMISLPHQLASSSS